MANEAKDDDDAGDVGKAIANEIEGTGNRVLVIESLVININAGDITSSREAGGQEVMEIVHRLLDLLHGGPGMGNMGPGPGNMGPGPGNMGHGPEMMGPGPHPGMPGMPGMGPNGMPGPHGEGMNMGHGPGNMGPGNPPQPAPDKGNMRMRSAPGPMVSPDVRGMHGQGMGMPGGPGMMKMMPGPPDNMGQDVKELIMRVGKLAWSNPQFRERLEKLVQEYERGQGKHPRAKQRKEHRAKKGKAHKARQHKARGMAQHKRMKDR